MQLFILKIFPCINNLIFTFDFDYFLLLEFL